MGSHPLGREVHIQEEHDDFEGRHLFKRNMIFLKGGTCSRSDVRSLYRTSPPLIVNNTESVREHENCDNGRKSVMCILFCRFSL